MRLIPYATVFACWTFLVYGNVEKIIFSAPESLIIPQVQPNLDQLKLDTLTPSKSTLRRQLEAAFPTSTDPEGPATWYLLGSLVDKRRYEIRVCWLATVRDTLPHQKHGVHVTMKRSIKDLLIEQRLTRPSNQQILQSTFLS